MSPPIPPHPPRSAKQLLQLGLAQMQRGQFQAAIASFEQVCRLSPHAVQQFKAQRALVSLYRKTGQDQTAIALCQDLCQHPHPKVQTWASQKLQQLSPNSPEPPSEALGFIPLDTSPEASTPSQREVYSPPQKPATEPELAFTLLDNA
ncbi:MAG: tetratricopeptide repeat protein, partial [Phormidium sp.]